MAPVVRGLFGFWAVLVALVVVLPAGVVALALCRTPEAAWWAAHRAFRVAGGLTGLRPRVTGRLPEGPFVAVSNHASNLDPLVLLAALPRPVAFVAKREMFSWPVVGAYARRLGAVPVERGRAGGRVRAFREVARAADAGRPVHVFPESTLSPEPGLLPFRLGAFRLAAERGLPVVPIALEGTRRALPADAALPRPGRLEVQILPPIPPGESPDPVSFRDQARQI
ncbi:MAG TPA: lysophospholipid acyltransferase family protein, partial [Thermoanaerobaculia bacterium]|nr:lysophospholipid acyltransferase family protein [Thermoanaerobaculia bacterium]